MALVKEEIGKFIHTYSDAGMMIKQFDTGILYSDTMDLKGYEHEYEETDQPIATEEPAEVTSDDVNDTISDTIEINNDTKEGE
jgi:hypothetical protein